MRFWTLSLTASSSFLWESLTVVLIDLRSRCRVLFGFVFNLTVRAKGHIRGLLVGTEIEFQLFIVHHSCHFSPHMCRISSGSLIVARILVVIQDADFSAVNHHASARITTKDDPVPLLAPRAVRELVGVLVGQRAHCEDIRTGGSELLAIQRLFRQFNAALGALNAPVRQNDDAPASRFGQMVFETLRLLDVFGLRGLFRSFLCGFSEQLRLAPPLPTSVPVQLLPSVLLLVRVLVE